jgi:hypothetical protein
MLIASPYGLSLVVKAPLAGSSRAKKLFSFLVYLLNQESKQSIKVLQLLHMTLVLLTTHPVTLVLNQMANESSL